MGQGTRRHFTPEFKAQAVKLVTDGGHPRRQVAGDLGIGESLLRRWRRDQEARTVPSATRPAATASQDALEEEV